MKCALCGDKATERSPLTGRPLCYRCFRVRYVFRGRDPQKGGRP
jgi:hypothetical protein